MSRIINNGFFVRQKRFSVPYLTVMRWLVSLLQGADFYHFSRFITLLCNTLHMLSYTLLYLTLTTALHRLRAVIVSLNPNPSHYWANMPMAWQPSRPLGSKLPELPDTKAGTDQTAFVFHFLKCPIESDTTKTYSGIQEGWNKKYRRRKKRVEWK